VPTELQQLTQVSKDAKPEEVKKKYHEAALTYHPDKSPERPEMWFKFLEAYEVCLSPMSHQAFS
jgi:molecular chaperone DnaJ